MVDVVIEVSYQRGEENLKSDSRSRYFQYIIIVMIEVSYKEERKFEERLKEADISYT